MLNKAPIEIIENNLNNFSCTKDKDIEYFLKEKAIDFERRGKSRTFLVIDSSNTTKESFPIIAYFTISLKVLKLEKISKSKVKKIDGFRNDITELPVHLIGQLGKNDLKSDLITGKEILDFSIDKIKTSIDIVGGRIVLIECRKINKIIDFYKNYGFNFLQDTSIKNEQYIQLEIAIK